MNVRIIGAGRAGNSFALALQRVGIATEVLRRGDAVGRAAQNVDAVLIATPDGAIQTVAEAIAPGDAVVMHCSGATGLDVLGPHQRCGSIHPLMALPDELTGAARLTANGWVAVAGDPMATRLADELGGRSFAVADEKRALYHATAAVAANHLVALLGQVERLAEAVDVPIEAFLDLARGSFHDVEAAGARAALTGPAARGDTDTIAAHVEALPADERDLYDALVAAARRLVEPGED